jgi:hypothetical protein
MIDPGLHVDICRTPVPPIVHEDTDCFPCGWPSIKPAPRNVHRDRMPQELVDADQERFCADSHQSATLFTKKITFECFRPIPDAPAQTIERPLRELVTLPRSKSRTVPLFVLTAQVTRLQPSCRFELPSRLFANMRLTRVESTNRNSQWVAAAPRSVPLTLPGLADNIAHTRPSVS